MRTNKSNEFARYINKLTLTDISEEATCIINYFAESMIILLNKRLSCHHRRKNRERLSNVWVVVTPVPYFTLCFNISIYIKLGGLDVR